MSVTNSHGGDALSIASVGAISLEVSGNRAMFDFDGAGDEHPVQIGTYSDLGDSYLTVSLNSNANSEAIEALTEAIRFSTSDHTAGERTVRFTLDDGDGTAHEQDSSTDFAVTVHVRAPVAEDETLETALLEDNVSTIPASLLLANDTIAQGGPLYINGLGDGNGSSATTAQGGTVELLGDGNIRYTPAANYSGPDSFSYTVKDSVGAVSNPATVSFTVDPVNDAPVFSGSNAIAMVGRDPYDLNGGSSGMVDPAEPVTGLTGNSFSFEIHARFDGQLGSDDFNMLIFPAIGEPDPTTGDGLHVGYRNSGAFTFGFWGDDLDYGDFDTANSDVGQWVTWAGTYDADTNTRRIYRTACWWRRGRQRLHRQRQYQHRHVGRRRPASTSTARSTTSGSSAARCRRPRLPTTPAASRRPVIC